MIRPFIEKLAKVENLSFIDNKLENSVTDVSDNLESFISTEDIDMSATIAKLTRQKEKLEKEIAKLNGMLSNKRFIENAPKSVVENSQKSLKDATDKLAKVREELKKIV